MNCEGLHSFTQSLGMRQECELSIFSIVLKILASTVGKEKEIKCAQVVKEEVKKFFLFLCEIAICKKNTKVSTKNSLKLIKDFGKISEYKASAQNKLYFHTLRKDDHKMTFKMKL